MYYFVHYVDGYGTCGHRHKTVQAVQKCLGKDHTAEGIAERAWCASIERSDGKTITWQECGEDGNFGVNVEVEL